MSSKSWAQVRSRLAEPQILARYAVNSAVFYITWFICVLWQMPWAIWATAAAIVVHLAWVRPGAGEWRVLVVCAAIGVTIDSILTLTGVFEFKNAGTDSIFGTSIAPAWLMAIWLIFATTLNVSMKPFGQRIWLAVLLGAFVAPLSYWAGFKLGVVSFPMGVPATLGLLALIWSFIFPTLLYVADGLGNARTEAGPSA